MKILICIISLFALIGCNKFDQSWVETDRKMISARHYEGNWALGEAVARMVLIIEENDNGDRRGWMIPYKGKRELLNIEYADYLMMDGIYSVKQ